MLVFPNLVNRFHWTKSSDLPGAERRRRAALEIVVLLAVLNWNLWTDNKRVLPPQVRLAGHAALALVTAIILLRQRPGRRELGLVPRSWQEGCPSLILATLVGVAALFAIGVFLGTIGNVPDLPRWIARNWYIDGLQQLLLQILLVPRLALLLSRDGSAIHDGERTHEVHTAGLGVSIASAAVFSFLHLPNLPLMALTLIAGVFWCEWFRRYRNFLALWLSHIVLAATVLYTLNGPSLRMLRVGIAYLVFTL